MHYASVRDIMKRDQDRRAPVRATSQSAHAGRGKSRHLTDTDVDLSLASDSIMKQEVITAERLLFSSGMTITRSKEIGTIRHIKIEV